MDDSPAKLPLLRSLFITLPLHCRHLLDKLHAREHVRFSEQGYKNDITIKEKRLGQGNYLGPGLVVLKIKYKICSLSYILHIPCNASLYNVNTPA